MRFLEKIECIRSKYSNEQCGTMGNALLYGVCNPSPPLAEHIIFKPMPNSVMKDMVRSYKNTFPEELLTLYRTMNGACLFWSVYYAGKKRIRVAMDYLSLYGIPILNPQKNFEPFDIRIEDLGRHKEVPQSWLKFGSYIMPDNISDMLDLFVDTNTSNVFALKRGNKDFSILFSWQCIDDCLCEIFDILSRNNFETNV